MILKQQKSSNAHNEKKQNRHMMDIDDEDLKFFSDHIFEEGNQVTDKFISGM